MNFTGSLPRFDALLRKLAVLAGSLVLCASTPQLVAQSPRFLSGSVQSVPGTTTQTYSFTNVASDRSGNLFIVEFDLGTVQKLPAGGSQLEPVDVSGVTRATAIAVDKGGDLFIANDSATPQGQPTSTIVLLTPAGAQRTLGSGWITPKGVAADDLGNVYVSGCTVRTRLRRQSTKYRTAQTLGCSCPSMDWGTRRDSPQIRRETYLSWIIARETFMSCPPEHPVR